MSRAVDAAAPQQESRWGFRELAEKVLRTRVEPPGPGSGRSWRVRWPALKRRVGCRGGVVSEMKANGGGRRAAHHARAADSTRPPAAWAIHAEGRVDGGRGGAQRSKTSRMVPNSNSSRPGRLRRPNRNKARTTAGQAVAEGCQGAGTAGEWSWGRSELEPAPGRLGVPLRGVTQLSLNSVIVGFQGEEGIAR